MRDLFYLATLFFLSSVHALQAKWTPAADGGPARFSKKYRDAAGIDDSRWLGDNDDGGFSLWPTTPAGWAIAAVAAVFIFVLLGQNPVQQWQTGQRTGGDGGAQAAPAGEAARAAFLKKYG